MFGKMALAAAFGAALASAGCFSATDSQVCFTLTDIAFPAAPAQLSLHELQLSIPLDSIGAKASIDALKQATTSKNTVYNFTGLVITPTSGVSDLSFVQTLGLEIQSGSSSPVELVDYTAPLASSGPLDPLSISVNSSVNLYPYLENESTTSLIVVLGGTPPTISWTADAQVCLSVMMQVEL